MSPSASDADFPSDLRALERDYELIRELGQGGMAAVFLARQRATGRLVAIKAVRSRYMDDPDALQRFTREAATVAGLDHPNIVRTLSIEQIDDRAVAIIMENIPGGTVRDWLREHGSLGAEQAESILRDVASALGYAHRRGIVHRDVKPENVFLDAQRNRAVLSDFGIARSIDGDGSITLMGAALGTPQYMSPEQIDGQMVDGRSDIYSLGVLGWELLTGRRPWAGESLYGVIYKQKHEDLPRITSLRPRVPANLLFAIERALVKDKKLRWQNTEEFLDQLTYNPPPVLAQPYPSGIIRGDDQPTVRFRRLALVRDEDHVDAATDDVRSLNEPPRETEPLVRLNSAQLPVAQFAAPDDDELRDSTELAIAPTAPVAEFAPLPPFEPHVEPTFDVSRRRSRVLRTLGLVVPLGIAAMAAFIVLGGDGNSDPSSRRTETSSAGSVSPTVTGPVSVPVDAKLPNDADRALVADTSAYETDSIVDPPPVSPRRSATPPVATRNGSTPPTTPTGVPADVSSAARQPATEPASNAARSESSKPDPVLDDPFKIPPSATKSSTKAPTLGKGALPSPRCRISATADQRACLDAYIAAGDVPMTQAFDALISELRRRAGAMEPPTVERARVEQRAWLAIRNTECPRTPAPSAGPLWAQSRSTCFSEMASSRAADLRETVRRLKR